MRNVNLATAVSCLVVCAMAADAAAWPYVLPRRSPVPTRPAEIVVWRLTAIGTGPKPAKARFWGEKKFRGILDLPKALDLRPEDSRADRPTWTPRKDSENPDRTIGFEVRQSVAFVQRDLDRFDAFFEAIAPLASESIRVDFQFESASAWPPIESKPPTAVDWKVTVIGRGNTLVRAKEFYDRDEARTIELLAEFGISSESIQIGRPSMKTHFDSARAEKPTGYTFARTLSFTHGDVDRFEELTEALTERMSDYFHFDFTFASGK